MDEAIVARWARVLVHYSLDLREGQRLLLRGGAAADPLLRAVYHEALLAGALVTLQIARPWQSLEFYRHATEAQIAASAANDLEQLERADVLLSILGETNTRALTGIDPARQALLGQSRGPAQALLLRRTSEGTLRWCGTLYPTEAYAQEAGMALDDYTALVQRACMLDYEEPEERWRALGARQAELAAWLVGKDRVQVTGPGTDLRFSIAGRRFVNDDGHYNFPGGEIFTGPVEESVEGTITFTGPTLRDGRIVSDVYLRFEHGVVVEARARQGQDYLDQALGMDDGARRVGEIAFGSNPGLTGPSGHPLFDEKIGGTMHLALGASYPETGGRNVSSLHWDLVCDLRQGGSVQIDDLLFASDGEFRV